jgi:DNA invertase Pin-like site-specific DNA recombinase
MGIGGQFVIEVLHPSGLLEEQRANWFVRKPPKLRQWKHEPCIALPWADSTSSTGRLMLAVLGGLADVERDLIRTRTAEGRSRAKAHGKHMGRPPSLTPEQKKEAIRRRAQGATLDELARSYNVSRATISRLTNL